MIKRAFSRSFMLVIGVMAALVILFSAAFQLETSSFLSKVKAEKSKQSAGTEQNVIVAAPNEAVPATQAEVGDADPTLIKEIVFDDQNVTVPPAPVKRFVSDFLKTLFRVFISPQAP